MNKLLLALAASFLLAAKAAYAKQDQSALFLTPSLGYTYISQEASDADYDLSGNIYMLNVDLEIISNGMAYHRLSLGMRLQAAT